MNLIVLLSKDMSENSFHKLQHNKYFVFGLVGLIAVMSLILLNLSMKVARKEAVITTNSQATDDLSSNNIDSGGTEATSFPMTFHVKNMRKKLVRNANVSSFKMA